MSVNPAYEHMQGNTYALRHGHTWEGGSSPTYQSWQAMLRRCDAPRNASWARYGGRGIRVCDRWASFDSFLADMGTRPVGHTLDRVDSENHYEPGNCRWATPAQQQQNRKCNRFTMADATAMASAVFAGETQASVARRFAVGDGYVSRIVNGVIWKGAADAARQQVS